MPCWGSRKFCVLSFPDLRRPKLSSMIWSGQTETLKWPGCRRYKATSTSNRMSRRIWIVLLFTISAQSRFSLKTWFCCSKLANASTRNVSTTRPFNSTRKHCCRSLPTLASCSSWGGLICALAKRKKVWYRCVEVSLVARQTSTTRSNSVKCWCARMIVPSSRRQSRFWRRLLKFSRTRLMLWLC